MRYLRELDLEVSLFLRGGEDAIREVEDRLPDVIILDIVLPGGSGWNVLATLKSRKTTRHIPVVVVSVVDEPARGLALGATHYLVKPVSREQLARVFGRTNATRESTAMEAPEQPTATHAPVVTAGTGAAPIPERDGPLVLLAEDNEANIRAYVDYLKMRGYTLIVARDGSEAVLEAKRHLPDLILMDVNMPGMDGLEATSLLRKDGRFESTPIIAITAFAMTGDRERCLEAGCTAYLSKPVSLRELHEKIQELLRDEDSTDE